MTDCSVCALESSGFSIGLQSFFHILASNHRTGSSDRNSGPLSRSRNCLDSRNCKVAFRLRKNSISLGFIAQVNIEQACKTHHFWMGENLLQGDYPYRNASSKRTNLHHPTRRDAATLAYAKTIGALSFFSSSFNRASSNASITLSIWFNPETL